MDFLHSEIFSHIVFQTLAMMATALLLPKVRITSIFGAVGCVVALAVVNATLWDVALFFSIPDTLSLHALMLLGTNGFIFWIIAKLLPGIEVDGFFSALIAPLIFTVLSVVFYSYGRSVDWVSVAKYLFEQALAVRAIFMQQKP